MNGNDTYTVSIMTSYGFTETCHPLVVGVDKAVASSVHRHYRKLCSFDDCSQTGQYVVMINRTWCINHADFEHETSLEYEEDWR